MPRDIGDVSTIGEVTADYLVRIVDNPNSDYPVEKLIPGAELTPAAGGVPVADTGGYYTGTNVETVLAEIGAGTALDGRYVPRAGATIWIPAGSHSVLLGSPSVQAGAPYSDAYLLDASSDEGVGSSVVLPSYWATFDVDIHWANAGAGSGDVKWLLCGQEVSEAETINGLGILAAATQTARAQNIEDVFTIKGLTNTGGRWLLMAYRSGSDGADTLANDIAYHGCHLRATSFT